MSNKSLYINYMLVLYIFSAMAVIVTGFGHYANVSVNPSSLAVHFLKDVWKELQAKNEFLPDMLTIENIPVTYKAVNDIVPSIWSKNPSLVIHIGLNPHGEVMLLESQSFNQEYDQLDVDENACGQNGCCSLCGPDKICCRLNLDELNSKLNHKGIICEISTDPGRFLCGYIYYKSLEIDPNRCLFIHIPPPVKLSTKKAAEYVAQVIIELWNQLNACSINHY